MFLKKVKQHLTVRNVQALSPKPSNIKVTTASFLWPQMVVSVMISPFSSSMKLSSSRAEQLDMGHSRPRDFPSSWMLCLRYPIQQAEQNTCPQSSCFRPFFSSSSRQMPHVSSDMFFSAIMLLGSTQLAYSNIS